MVNRNSIGISLLLFMLFFFRIAEFILEVTVARLCVRVLLHCHRIFFFLFWVEYIPALLVNYSPLKDSTDRVLQALVFHFRKREREREEACVMRYP